MRFTTSVIPAAVLASGAFAKTISVEVGSGGLSYSPNTTTAAVGDILEFSFFPRTHNVVRGSFESPCNVGDVQSPFFSGSIPVTSGKSDTTFSVTVNDTMPMWIYCSIPMHCQLGMVMVVNPPTSGEMTLSAYKSAAAKASNSTTPFSSARGGVISQGSSSTASTAGTAAGGKGNGTATSTAARATSTKSAASENSKMGWGMWAALAGAAALSAVAL